MPILLFALWLAYSGRVTVDVVITGVIAVVLIVAFLARFCGWSVQRDIQFAARIIPFIGFVCRLIVEVFIANFHMIALVLSKDPNARIRPRIVAHKTNLKTSTGRVALANSITLTPGTVTVDVGDDCVYVHAIDEYAQEGLAHNALEKQLENMERNL